MKVHSKYKAKLDGALDDLKAHRKAMEEAVPKDQPLWKQCVHAMAFASAGIALVGAVVILCMLACTWLMPQTIQTITENIGFVGDVTMMDVALLVGGPTAMMAVFYGILLYQAARRLVGLHRPFMKWVRRTLKFKPADGGESK